MGEDFATMNEPRWSHIAGILLGLAVFVGSFSVLALGPGLFDVVPISREWQAILGGAGVVGLIVLGIFATANRVAPRALPY